MTAHHRQRHLPARVLQAVFALFGLLASLSLLADDLSVQVYTPQHQTAEALAPAIDDLLQDNESVRAFNGQLIVNASAATQREVASLLQQIDRTPRNLMISVQNANDSGSVTDESSVSGGIRTGRTYLGGPPPIVHDSGLVIRQDGVQVHTNRTYREGTRDLSQQVRAVEGYASWIGTGQSAPVRSYDRYGYPTTEYVDAEQGFYVTAHLQGDRVTIEISATNDSFSDTRRGVIDTQGVRTRVTGAVGEWIPLGTINTSIRDQSHDYTSREQTTGGSVTGISVRVVPAD